jgi:hypothetical protein
VPEQDETKTFLSFLNVVQVVVVCQGNFFLKLKQFTDQIVIFLTKVQVGSYPTPEDPSERPDIGPDVKPLLSGDSEQGVLEDSSSETLFSS